MFFTGIVTDGGVDYPFSGRITNKIGKGYSPLDGYGFINAEAAVAVQPDLIVSTLRANNNQPPQGSKVTLTATIKNQGNFKAGASKTEFLLDGQTVLGLVDTPNLAPGAHATISVDWLTAAVAKGKHTIKATADRNNAVTESTETNNTKSLAVTIK
jgi:subtilase family serine protease